MLYAADIPETLRGGIEVDSKTIEKALSLKAAGWEYVMPSPKSDKASWGNHDGRTTWWTGYWKNSQSKETSSVAPVLVEEKWIGNNKGGRISRRGGTPRRPSKLEWLLSSGGGIKPN